MKKICEKCGKEFSGWGKRKYCGSQRLKIGCSYEEYINREKPLKDRIKFSDKDYQWRISNLSREANHCQGCGVLGRQRTILDFPDLPVLYVDRIRSINDIIKDNNITTVEQSYLCEEFWEDGIVLCVYCYDKKYKTRLAKVEKTLLKNKLKAEKIKN